MEKRAKYAKLHPEMSNLDLTKILSKKYRELPDKKKVCFCNPFLSLSLSILYNLYNILISIFITQKKYVDDFLRDKESFVQSMMKFR